MVDRYQARYILARLPRPLVSVVGRGEVRFSIICTYLAVLPQRTTSPLLPATEPNGWYNVSCYVAGNFFVGGAALTRSGNFTWGGALLVRINMKVGTVNMRVRLLVCQTD